MPYSKKNVEETVRPSDLIALEKLRLKKIEDYTIDDILFLFKVHRTYKIAVQSLAEYLGVEYRKLLSRINSVKKVAKTLKKQKETVPEVLKTTRRELLVQKTLEKNLLEEKEMPRRRKSDLDVLGISDKEMEELVNIAKTDKPGPVELAILREISSDVSNDAVQRAKVYYTIGKMVFEKLLTDAFPRHPELVEMVKKNKATIIQAIIKYLDEALEYYEKKDELISTTRQIIEELVDIINRQDRLINILWRYASPYIKFEVETKLLLDVLDRVLLARALGISLPKQLPKILKSYSDKKFLEAVETWLKQVKNTQI